MGRQLGEGESRLLEARARDRPRTQESKVTTSVYPPFPILPDPVACGGGASESPGGLVRGESASPTRSQALPIRLHFENRCLDIEDCSPRDGREAAAQRAGAAPSPQPSAEAARLETDRRRTGTQAARAPEPTDRSQVPLLTSGSDADRGPSPSRLLGGGLKLGGTRNPLRSF